MNEILYDYRDRFCISYLDDIIIYSPTFERHLDHLRAVLQRLKEKGIKVKPKKLSCSTKLYYTHVPRISGHRGGLYDGSQGQGRCTTAKEQKPETIGKLRQLLGFIG